MALLYNENRLTLRQCRSALRPADGAITETVCISVTLILVTFNRSLLLRVSKNCTVVWTRGSGGAYVLIWCQQGSSHYAFIEFPKPPHDKESHSLVPGSADSKIYTVATLTVCNQVSASAHRTAVHTVSSHHRYSSSLYSAFFYLFRAETAAFPCYP